MTLLQKKIFLILLCSITLAIKLSADVGSSHVIKAHIRIDKKQYTGYFKVWGYLYLQDDSLKLNTQKFTERVRAWIYGDTLTLYSEIVQVKSVDLILFPHDRKVEFSKNLIDEIIPLELLHQFIGRGSYSQIISADKQWLSYPVQLKTSFGVISGADCVYTVLYFSKPDQTTKDLVKAVETELLKEAATSINRYKIWSSYLEKLKTLQVIIFYDCST